MKLSLECGAPLLGLFACVLGCGPRGEAQSAGALDPSDEWPPVVQAPPDATDVASVVTCRDGVGLRVRALLVAVSLPCPACNVGERRGNPEVEPPVGKSLKRKVTAPGCAPCLTSAVTFTDRGASATHSDGATLRATGAAEALQARHVGKEFLLTGTCREKAEGRVEFDVTDVGMLTAPM